MFLTPVIRFRRPPGGRGLRHGVNMLLLSIETATVAPACRLEIANLRLLTLIIIHHLSSPFIVKFFIGGVLSDPLLTLFNAAPLKEFMKWKFPLAAGMNNVMLKYKNE
jgi:hypothetical protein